MCQNLLQPKYESRPVGGELLLSLALKRQYKDFRSGTKWEHLLDETIKIGKGSAMSTTMAKITHLCLGLSVCCLTSQSLNVTLVNPGENISIGCGNDMEQVYWYLQSSGRPPAPILRSFGGAASIPFYYDTGSQSKYDLQAGNKLFIHNFTKDDCATYYCAELRDGVFRFFNGSRLNVTATSSRKDITDFFNGTRLNITDVVTGRQNLTSDTQKEQRCGIFQNSLLIVTIVLNFILIVIILVLIKKLCTALNCKPAMESEAPQEDVTYSVIQLPKRQNASSREITTYSDLRLPTS
nr:uncharacterized protein LOC111850270 [Paramormyrops kingsleyae]